MPCWVPPSPREARPGATLTRHGPADSVFGALTKAPSKPGRRGLLVVFLCSALFATAGASATVAPAPSLVDGSGRRPNVLLVTVDTLRADHLGAYGYRLGTSPEIDRLASEGVLFTDAITPVPTTAPALASLLTSRHADQHGVRENLAEFPGHLPTMASAFDAAGYQTAAFYGNGAIRNGFGAGFERFEPFGERWFFRDRRGAEKAIAFLDGAREPWFLWVHFMDPHGPYNSSPPGRSRAFAYPDSPALRRELQQVETNSGFGILPRYQRLDGLTRVGEYVRRYDGEILGTDAAIGQIRAALEASGQLDRTLLVVTADHGEALGEDEYFFQHGTLLHEPGVRVPLIMRHPGLPSGLRSDTPASLVDVFPTVAALAGLPAPDGSVGRNLVPSLRGAPTDGSVVRVSYTVTPTRQTAVRRGRWELRGTPHPEGPPDDFATLELFDIRASPARKLPPQAESAIRAELEPLVRAAARQVRENPSAARKMTEDEKARLRALGYID